MSATCMDCGKPVGDDGDSDIPACAGCIQANREEGARLMAEADAFRNPTPPPIPVRKRYYITECEHCGWVGSSEQCGGGDDDIVCPVCCSSICGDEPDEADIAKHGEAVMQRILAAEAARDRLLIAFHDAIRRPLGVTPDSGAEFYDQRLADEAEERRSSASAESGNPAKSASGRLVWSEVAARAAALADARNRERQEAGR